MTTLERSVLAEDKIGLANRIEIRSVVLASSVGTTFEWYDFYLYLSLYSAISAKFFSGVDPTTATIFALLTFSAGFAVRPFGAIVFGRLGDLVGRKYVFLTTIVIMGLATFAVGLLPGYSQIGIAAPVVLVALRLVQGLAVGGEYGGAATYVAEHAPPRRRGVRTSWLQTTASLGLILSLLVILGCRAAVAPTDFERWGWRLPFLFSLILLAISVWIRLRLDESPVFRAMKAEGTLSREPLRESFGNWANLRMILLAFAITAGVSVVWTSGQFYAPLFLNNVLRVDPQITNVVTVIAIVAALPFFLISGWLSDRIGRKWIILAGCIVAAFSITPIFKGLTFYANPVLAQATATAPVRVVADPRSCSFQFNPTGLQSFVMSCDTAKAALASRGVPYVNEAAPPGTTARVLISGRDPIVGYDASGPLRAAEKTRFETELTAALAAAGYPARANSSLANWPMVTLLLWLLVVIGAVMYGPLSALLVEMFPSRIRTTSFSLPYQLGMGWGGGFLLPSAFALVATTGDIYRGLLYPIVITSVAAVIGLVFIREPVRERP